MTEPSSRPPLFERLFAQRTLLPMARVFVVLVCVLLFASVAWMLWSARETRLQEAQMATSNLAYSVSRHAQDTLKKADTILVSLSERLQVDGRDPQQLQRLHRLLQVQVRELQDLHGLFVYDRDGHWLVSSFDTIPHDANNSDREYFRFHRDNPDLGPHIGLPVRSRTTGTWVIPLSRRLNDAQGQFAGVLLATIDMDYFLRFYRTFDTMQYGAISLSLDNGTLLVRQPFAEALIGADLSAGPVFHDYLPRQPVGNLSGVSLVDGEARLYSYRHLEGYPLVATAALAEREVLASWMREVYVQMGITLFVVVLLGLFGFHLIRQIKAGLATEQALRTTRDSLELLNQRLEKLALEDELTGLANRRHFMSRLAEEVLRAGRNQRSLGLLMLDVDYFKQFNDLYGHSDGDVCLRSLGRVLRAAQKRPGDLAARYGGEEFCLLLPETDAAGAQAVAEQVRGNLEALAIAHAGHPLGIVTVSIGVHALVPVGDGTDAATLLHCADRALYQAKAKGRNRVLRFEISLFKEKL
ncbi:GGDEF domain-containing protein [Pseudomonas sp. UL073]|uniref:diguanylate cyclase n=1 Tax=Zestomonas insulae TaxID=2809017 RepID=A0ABS2IAU9_9GAMM|nr:sensor domain-containing diguanylate cyclase [Pseudomonas insulae]MBM7060147.1 GGDEF domain-containing protein [Pseudomonas insulae]